MSSRSIVATYQPSTLLAVAVMGAYLLVVVGATTTLTDAAAACGTWPACGGDVLNNPRLAVAWGHRLAAVAVGVLVLAAGITCWRAGTPRRVRVALVLSVVLYPVQIGVGALAATTTLRWVSGVHLAVGMGIFVGLVAALAWQLLDETPTSPPRATDEPAGSGASGSSKSSQSDPPGSAAAEAAIGTASDPDGLGSNRSDPGVSNALRPHIIHAQTTAGRVRTVLATYVSMMKPRLMWLLCLVAAAGMALAAGSALEASTVVATLAGGVLAIGASGTFNHVLERDTDRRMERTADRPLATHEVPVRNAVVFGLALAIAALAVFASVNRLVAALGLTAILFYTVVYTLVLKPNTALSTVLGGAAGALPALIGWVAVTGAFGLPGIALAGVIFLWTPAHFYNLALAYKDDYERGGFPLLPVVRGERLTRTRILWYLAATLLGASILATLADLGWVYAGSTVLLGGVFLWTVVRLHRERTERAAFRAFHASNAFLGTVLVAIVLDTVFL